jgi:peptidyl-prolyl cis-trans isomerase B (cyclophilin B)
MRTRDISAPRVFRRAALFFTITLTALAAPTDAGAQNETSAKPEEKAAAASVKPAVRPVAVLETTKGKIVLELYPSEAPKTVENFITLAKKGFYNGLLFHRVVPGFVIQTGDPKGDGSGGPGYTIPDEPNTTLKHAVGAVGMAKTPAPNSAGSQFYIVIVKPADFLDGRYTVFAKVIEGQEVAEKIIVGDRMTKVTISETGRPDAPATVAGNAAVPVAPVLLPAKLVRMATPLLPNVTLKREEKSALRVKFVIEADGKHTAELLDKSGSEKVDKAVQEALARWQWEPARQDGKPVKSEVEFTVELPLKQQR